MSTALVPTKPSFMRRLASVFQRTPADLTRTLVGNANAGGWSIVRGQTPSDFQGTGEEVRLRGWERHPVVHACIRAIADLVAAVPLEIIDRPPGEADAKVLPNHEALALFRGENGGESEFRFKARTATHFLTYGNAFSVLERNGTRGLPRWLRVIQPTAVQYVWLDPKTDMIRLYDWRDLQGQVHTGTPAENMLHFRDLDATDGLFGFPRGAAALRAIMADSEASEYVRQIVTNHGLPSLVVMVDGSPTMDELVAGEDRFREKWVSRGNRGGTSFMAGVKDLKQLAFSLSDLEFPDLRATTREDICVAFNVDRRIIGVSSGTSDGGLSGEQFREARFRLIQQAVYPVMRCLEDEINRVLTPEYGEVWCRFSEEYIAAITEDVTQTSARVVSELNAKIRSIEEARDAVGLDINMKPTDHLPGGLTVAESEANAQAMGAAAIEAAKAPKQLGPGELGGRAMLTRAMRLDKDEASALWGKFDETARKQEGPYERTAMTLFNLEAEGVARVLLTLAAGEAIASDPFIAAALARIEADYAPGAAYHRNWLDRYTKLITQTVKLGGSDLGSQIGIDFALENPRAQAVIRQRAADLVTNVTETTRQSIRETILAGRTEGLSVSEMAKRIQDTTFGEIGASRAQTIARTETVGALNAGAYQAATQSNLMRSKEWLTQGDDRVRDSHAAINGERVDIGASFSNGLRYPHDPNGPAEETINCFLPETIVRGSFVAGLRSHYSGPAREMITRSGKRLAVTANHPILTLSGLRAAHLLCEGDYVIADRTVVAPQPFSLPQIDEHDVPARIEDVFDTLRIRGSALRHHLTADDFHGEARFVQGDVDVVLLDGLLLPIGDATRGENGGDVRLMSEAMRQTVHARNCAPNLGFERVDSTSTDFPGTTELSPDSSGIATEVLPFQPLRIGTSPDHDAMLSEAGQQGGTGDAAAVRQLLERFPTLIAADEIIEVRDLQWTGHVFDLQSVTGLMIAGGIVSSNCRCTTLFSDLEAGVTA